MVLFENVRGFIFCTTWLGNSEECKNKLGWMGMFFLRIRYNAHDVQFSYHHQATLNRDSIALMPFIHLYYFILFIRLYGSGTRSEQEASIHVLCTAYINKEYKQHHRLYECNFECLWFTSCSLFIRSDADT